MDDFPSILSKSMCRGLEKAKELKKKMKNILFSGYIPQRDVSDLVYEIRKTPVEGTLSQK